MLLIEYNTDEYRQIQTYTSEYSVIVLNTNFTYWYVLRFQYRPIQILRAGGDWPDEELVAKDQLLDRAPGLVRRLGPREASSGPTVY